MCARPLEAFTRHSYALCALLLAACASPKPLEKPLEVTVDPAPSVTSAVTVSTELPTAAASSGVTAPFTLTFGPLEKARSDNALAEGKSIGAAVELWQATHGSGCPHYDDLVREQMLQPGHQNDPWGNPYAIECKSGHVVVRSPGSDGRLGTADDVVAPSR